MKRKLTSRFVVPFTALSLFFLLAFTVRVQEGWDIPSEYKTMKNPVADSDGSIGNGEELFKIHCKSCHGKYGEGDGPKADGLKAYPGDFTSDEFQSLSDGTLFYMTKFGKDEMPEFSKKISDDEEIWDIVNFMRTL